MKVDLIALLVSIVPPIITSVISYLSAVKKSNSEILSVKEETEREIKSIKADTEREIKKIQAQTDSQIKIMEAEGKSKENEKMTEFMFSFLEPIISNPDNLERLYKLGKNPTEEEVIKLLKDTKR